ncbi:hypothetical protein J4219_05405 [Candidatus Woesearchaeota archaeon]|nr:hypothetical protein [Candidatus Woesearchaeota archaeon]
MNKRLKCRQALVVFTQKVLAQRRTSDKYIVQSMRRRNIISASEQVTDNDLFILDDVTAFGINYPAELIERLCVCNETTLLSAEELATQLASILPPLPAATLSGGGVITYTLLKRAGYKTPLEEIASVERTYREGIPECRTQTGIERTDVLLIDDILASGQTLYALLEGKTIPLAAFLLASTNVSKGNKGYRIREKSTLPSVEQLYCAKLVNGTQVNGCNKKPAILSLRYLLTKAIDNEDYKTNYLSKKFGGIEPAKRIAELIRGIDREPIEILRRDPMQFIQRYGG